jgi:hypothetical protein
MEDTRALVGAAPTLAVCHQAGGALQKYQVQAVVANLLHTRKDRVLIVQQQAQQGQRAGPGAEQQQQQQGQQQQLHVDEVLRPPEEPHIERRLVARVVALHQQFKQQSFK